MNGYLTTISAVCFLQKFTEIFARIFGGYGKGQEDFAIKCCLRVNYEQCFWTQKKIQEILKVQGPNWQESWGRCSWKIEQK